MRCSIGVAALIAACFLHCGIFAQTPPQNKRTARFDDSLINFWGIVDNKNATLPNQPDNIYVVTLPCRGNAELKNNSELGIRNLELSGTESNKNNSELRIPHSELKSPCFYQFTLAVPNPLERSVLDDAGDGKWQNWDVVSSSLIAEGLTDVQKVNYYCAKVRAITDSLRKQLANIPAEQHPRIVFETLHQKLLTGKYDTACTDLVQSLDSGNFNCVSATVLFHAMARQTGLNVCGVEMQGHALSRVRIGNQTLDLETTCAEWFRLSPQERLKSQRVVNAEFGMRHSELANTELKINSTFQIPNSELQIPPREVSDVQLIATIYYNKGVDELTAGKYNAAAAANIKALRLDPNNENAWKNLLATLNNWAIAFASQECYLDAAQLLDEGRLIAPDYDLFRSNQVHTYYHWIKSAADSRDYEKAAKLFQLAEERLPNQPNLRYLNYMVRRTMAKEYFAAQNDKKAFEQYDLVSQITLPGMNVAETELSDVTEYVRQLLAQKEYRRAVQIIDLELPRHSAYLSSADAATTNNSPIAQATFVQPVSESQILYSASRPIQPSSAPLQTSSASTQISPASPPFTSPILLQPDEETLENQQIIVKNLTETLTSDKAELLNELKSLRERAVKNL